jgi:hypothetical protein
MMITEVKIVRNTFKVSDMIPYFCVGKNEKHVLRSVTKGFGVLSLLKL